MLPVAAADNNNICYKCHDNKALAQAADLMGNGPYTNRAPGWPTVFNTADGTVTTAGSVAYKAGAHEKGGVKPTVWPSSASYPALTLAEDGQCINCHDPHGSGNPYGLLTPTAQTLCLTCHNGTQATTVDMSKVYGHKTATNHNLGENWSDGTVVNHAVCNDCHKVHVLTVSDKLKGNDGIDKTGVKVSTLDPNLQYQLCLKCHSAYGSRTAAMLPGTGKLDLRQQFLTTNNNHHGVFGRVSNTYITVNNMSATGAAILNRAGGLPAGTPVLRCTDCHDWHTSNNVDALKWPFGTSNEKESFCKKCHSPYIYDGNETTGPPPAGTKSGYDHRGRNAHFSNTVGGCIACHGGGKNALVYGGTHGGNVTFALGAGKRFIGGTYINNWRVGSCTTSGGCNNHNESYGVKTF
jgi:predicted CXXCH cytochrome family protein